MTTWTVDNTRTGETAGTHETLRAATAEWSRLGGIPKGWRIFRDGDRDTGTREHDRDYGDAAEA